MVSQNNRVAFVGDFVHPNAAGAQAIADQVVAYADPLVRSMLKTLSGGNGGPPPLPTIPAAPLPTIAAAPTCTSPANPVMTSRLTASPDNPTTATEVTLAVTITNDSCATFAPEVMAIGGRDPAGNVTDPYQRTDFVLAPNESRTITQPVTLSTAGSHEFFMAYLRVNGGWNRIPDTNGDSASMYVTVTDAASGNTVPPGSASCSATGTLHSTSLLTASPTDPTTATEVTLAVTIANTGCAPFAPEVMAIGGRDPAGNVTDPLQTREFVLGPGESTTITVPVVLTTPGTHEFFMAYLRVNGGWHRIPDANGDSASIYVTVTDAVTTDTVQPPFDPTAAPAADVSAPIEPTTGNPVQVDTSAMADMDIGAATCNPAGECYQEIGAVFTVTSLEGNFIGSCTLEGDRDDMSHMQTCKVPVPRGTTVLVTEDVTTITPGTAPVENPLSFDTSGDPGAASHWGVSFRNQPIAGSTVSSGTSDIAIVATENGQPVYDACFILLEYGNEGCDENQDGKITYEGVPLGTYTVRQTRDLGSGRTVPDSTITVTGAADADGWERKYVDIQASAVSPDPSASVDIALITREPNTGQLLTDTCYVLVGFSNQGCDENGDGQVTFAAVPYGTYTVQQTRTPAGYATITDYTIEVEPVQGMPGSAPIGVPMGFIVKQAPEQNSPSTRNVSVVMLDMTTHQRVAADVCVELVGASNVGCDEDLRDGQIDFIDVPAGGPYELRFSNLPAGSAVGTVGGPLAINIDAGPGAPSNVVVFVLLAGSGGAGSGMIEPTTSNPSIGSQGSANTSSATDATVVMTFRGCPDGFNPDTDDFYANCTIPLDAPDTSFLYHGGDGQGGMSITGLEREFDGAYIFRADQYTMSLQLSGMAPVLRDGYQVFGNDSVNGETYSVNLVTGETRQVYVFYYYWP